MRPPRRHPLFTALLFTAFAIAALAPPPASAVVRNWNNPAGGSVGINTNWTPNGIPTAADNLIFPLGGTMTITFPSAVVPQVISHDYRSGIYNISCDGTHSTSLSFAAGQSSNCGVNITGGTFQPFSVYLGTSAGSYGRLTMRTAGGFPTPPPPSLFQTDSSQGGNYAVSGNARLEILGGSLHILAGPAIFANSPGTLCTLTVAGRSALLFQNSTFSTTNPRRGTAQFGAFGNFVGNMDNGGFVHVAGDAWLALRPGSTGLLQIGANTTTFSPGFAAEKAFRIGDTGFTGSGAGTADLRLYKGSMIVGGPCVLGDVDGNSSACRLYIAGGLFRMSGGFTRVSGTNYGHQGGILHLEGGAISWPFATWPVTSNIGGSPELWISNGLTTTFGTFEIGRGGNGLLRVSRPGTRINTLGAVVLGDSTTGSGSLVVDSSAVVHVSSQLIVGNRGAGSLTVKNGAQFEPVSDLFFGVTAGSSATGLVRGAGSLVTLNHLLNLGGVGGVPGGPSVLTVDSSAVVEVTTGAGLARIYDTTGHLVVRDGATFRAATITLDGACDLQAATIDASSTIIGPAGRLSGRGHVTGSLVSSGLVDLVPTAGQLGALRVDGGVLLASTGQFGVALGRGAGPRADTLVCGGSLNVSGILALSADPSFVRVVGDTFVVATASSVSGAFTGVTWNGAPGAALFTVVVQPTRIVVVTKAATLDVDEGAARAGTLRFRAVSNAGRTAFVLDLPQDADVRVKLLDVTGREIARLHEGRLGAGTHTLANTAAALPSGVYFARAEIVRDGVTSVRTAKAVHLR